MAYAQEGEQAIHKNVVVNLRQEQKVGIGFVRCWNMALTFRHRASSI